MDNLTSSSAAALARAIRSGEVSSAEVVEAHLRRIEAVNGRLNAVVQIDGDRALERARRADEALANAAAARTESAGPLHGVPFTLKDSIDTAGVVSTWGTAGRAGFVPEQDATVAARLRAAGAILLGKTNTPEFTLSFETDNAVYGRTNNPYDLERTPGGSSGGAAAIVASGGSPLDIGSDTGGSIRLPAHFCGIAGIRPTSGRVPRTGHAVGPGGLLDAFTQLGPMARRVEDLTLVLPIIAGPDGRDPFIVPVTLKDPADVSLAGLRVAFHTDNGLQRPIPEIEEAVRAAAGVLADAGAILGEDRPAAIEASRELYAELLLGWDGGAWARTLLKEAGTAEEEATITRFLNAPTKSARELVNIIASWDVFRADMLAFLDDYDLIVSPVNAYPAIPHGQTGQHIMGYSYTNTYNLTGWPAAVVRAGTSPEGLPIGVQLIARPWREDVALAAAAAVEETLGGWQPPSVFD
jgi:amidase